MKAHQMAGLIEIFKNSKLQMDKFNKNIKIEILKEEKFDHFESEKKELI